MTPITLIGPDSENFPPNVGGDSGERGWSFKKVVDAINTMMAELYTTTDPAGAGVAGSPATATETTGSLRKTVLSFQDYPLSFSDDAGVGQWATSPIYTFPAGLVTVLGATVDLSLTLTETWWVDTSAGSVGVGTVASSDASVLATTRQNIDPVTAVAALVDQAGPVTAQNTGVLVVPAAGGDAAVANLNLLIDDDAAHFPDLVATGDFAADQDWTKGTGWTIAAGVATAVTASTSLSQVIAADLIPGVTYSLSFDMTRTAGSLTPYLGGTAGTARSTDDTFVEEIVAGAGGTIAFTGAGFSGTVDNVTLTPVTAGGVISGTVTLVWASAGDFSA